MSRRLVGNHTTSLTLLSSLLFLFTITLISAEGFSIPTFSSHPARSLFPHNQGRRQRRRQSKNRVSTVMSPPSGLVIPSCMDHLEPATALRGGSGTTSTQLLFAADPSESSKCPVSKSMAIFGTLWGSLGVVYILTKAIKRVLPIALEPLTGGLILSPIQWM